VCIGDSITEGNNATTNADRWVELLGSGLVSAHGTQAMVYRPAGDGGGLASQPWTLTNGAMVTEYGLGRRAREMGASATASIAITGTGFAIVYVKGPGLGTFEYQVDGGSATSVNTANSQLVGGQFETVSGLSSGSHTVLVTRTAGTVYLEGIIPRVGTGGFRIWEAGHGGYGVYEYTDGPYEHWADALTTIDPDLIVLMLGGVDYIYSRPSAQVRIRYQQLVTRLQSLTDASIFVLGEWRLGGSNTYAEDWSNYVDEIADLVSDDGDIAYLDLVPTFTPGYVPASLPLVDDGTHPTDTGMDTIADMLLAELAT
jgi:lysophospholipase L1-like esterase